MIGLVLAAYGHYWADAVAAIVVAVLISVLAFRLGKRTIDSLVDTAPPGFSGKIEAAVRQIPGVVDVERVRMRTVGPRHFVDVVIQVPRTVPLDRVTVVKEAVQAAVAGAVGEADITITATPVALDSESVLERVMVIARNLALRSIMSPSTGSAGGFRSRSIWRSTACSRWAARTRSPACWKRRCARSSGRTSRSRPISSRCSPRR